jgi:hypothetical protein
MRCAALPPMDPVREEKGKGWQARESAAANHSSGDAPSIITVHARGRIEGRAGRHLDVTKDPWRPDLSMGEGNPAREKMSRMHTLIIRARAGGLRCRCFRRSVQGSN